MTKRILLTLFCACVATASFGATLIVDGIGTGGHFATLQDAIDSAMPAGGTIEIQTDLPVGGASITTATTMTGPLTIQAGTGFTPVFTSPFSLIPANQDQLISLTGITILPIAATTDAVTIGTNLTVSSCTLTGGSGISAGINAAADGPGTTATLTINGSTITGQYALFAGRSIQDYIINRSALNAASQTNGFMYGVLLAGNNPISRTAGVGSTLIDAPLANTPRTLTMDRTIITASRCIGWPVGGGPQAWYTTGTVGSVSATNCIFHSPEVNAAGNRLSFFGGSLVPSTGLPNTVSFNQCTFRSSTPIINALNGDLLTVNLQNNLFDSPNVTAAAMPVYGQINVFFTGDINAFNVIASNSYSVPAGTNDNLRIMDFSDAAHPPIHVGTELVLSAAQATDLVTDENGLLTTPAGIALAANKGAASTVTVDFQGEPRPQGGPNNDLGADEIVETAAVNDWTIY